MSATHYIHYYVVHVVRLTVHQTIFRRMPRTSVSHTCHMHIVKHTCRAPVIVIAPISTTQQQHITARTSDYYCSLLGLLVVVVVPPAHHHWQEVGCWHYCLRIYTSQHQIMTCIMWRDRQHDTSQDSTTFVSHTCLVHHVKTHVVTLSVSVLP